jgi:hypothetical protein
MRNINPCSAAQCRSRFVTLALAMSMLISAAPGISQMSAPIVRKVQEAQRESRAAIRFSQRLYRFYKLSENTSMALRASN